MEQDWKDELKVTPMNDGGMGSLVLSTGTTINEPRKMGSQASECRFSDEDGVVVLVALNLDEEGRLFELDVWKVDFQPLKSFPSDVSAYSIVCTSDSF